MVMDDEQIIQLFLNRDENALRVIREKYHEMCLKLAKNMLKDTSDAEECVNDAYLKLWDIIPPLQPESLQGLLLLLVRRISLHRITYNRAEKRNEEVNDIVEELDQVVSCAIGEEVDEKMLLEAIEAFLRSRPKKQRLIFFQRYWFSQSIQEIALEIGTSPARINSILFHMREKLKVFLQKEGVLQART